MTGQELFEAALQRVESESIRRWAQGEHNRRILVQIADGIVAKKKDHEQEVYRFATWMICEAMGM